MIVLIGATGTVGRHVAHELTARGMPFHALVRDARLSRAAWTPSWPCWPRRNPAYKTPLPTLP